MKLFESADSWKLNLHKKSVRNACRQMQTVWDSNLHAMYMFGLISKNYQFLEKLIFLKKWPMVLGRTFAVSFFVVSDLEVQMMQNKRTFWNVLDCL